MTVRNIDIHLKNGEVLHFNKCNVHENNDFNELLICNRNDRIQATINKDEIIFTEVLTEEEAEELEKEKKLLRLETRIRTQIIDGNNNLFSMAAALKIKSYTLNGYITREFKNKFYIDNTANIGIKE